LGDLTCHFIEPGITKEDNLGVSVTTFADGYEPPKIPGGYSEDVVFAIGKWLANFHKASRKFSEDFPEAS
jgi:hypothetical protein